MKIFLRVLIIAAILVILVFLSIAVVRVVPKALSSLASATVSIGNLFGGDDDSDNNTATTTTPDYRQGNGFIVIGSTSTAATSTRASSTFRDLLTPRFGSYPYNNYVPTPGSNTGSGSSNTGSQSSASSAACSASGKSDIAVTILSRGIINSAGQFIETNSMNTSNTVSIRFKVENRGACATGAWSLQAQMPSLNAADQVRTVNGNKSIPAGAAVTGEARFDNPRTDTPVVAIAVQSSGSAADSTISNNVASVTLSVSGSNTGGNGGTIGGDGRPDLSVRVVRIGILDYGNNFIPVNSGYAFRSSDRIAAQFEVSNQGRTATGQWAFKANLSSNQYGQYNEYDNAQYENSIVPGASVLYTVAFPNSQPGYNTITLSADIYNQISEYNEGNNSIGAGFNVAY